MTKLFEYSCSLKPSRPQPPADALHEYAYNEFLISLPDSWKLIPTAEERTINFYSDALQSSITISVDFYEVPDEKAHALAEHSLNARTEALEKLHPGQVEIFLKTIKPHSSGTGLELGFAAETPTCHFYMYVGYVTRRKVLNFTLVCPLDREGSSSLFNKTMENFRPKLP